MTDQVEPSHGADLPRIPYLAELLQDVPLHSPKLVQYLFSQTNFSNFAIPESVDLHCDHPRCGGLRRHQLSRRLSDFHVGEMLYIFVAYRCTNCTNGAKIFALKAEKQEGKVSGVCTKIYQEPTFGNPIPKKLFEVIGESNRNYFLQARRAIARSLGIGAFAYYRRIIENTKLGLVGAVLGVARATDASKNQIELLEKAKEETQFSKAITMLRDAAAIPPVLLINGQNPLALLHDLLSEGIHQYDDNECLKRARDAEVILGEIATRIQIAITENKAVKEALANIMNRRSGSPSGSAGS